MFDTIAEPQAQLASSKSVNVKHLPRRVRISHLGPSNASDPLPTSLPKNLEWADAVAGA